MKIVTSCTTVHDTGGGGLKKEPTIPLFKLFPGLPSIIFSSLAAFLGGIFLAFAYDLVKTNNTVVFRLSCTNGVGEAKRCFEMQRRGRSSSDVVAGEG